MKTRTSRIIASAAVALSLVGAAFPRLATTAHASAASRPVMASQSQQGLQSHPAKPMSISLTLGGPGGGSTNPLYEIFHGYWSGYSSTSCPSFSDYWLNISNNAGPYNWNNAQLCGSSGIWQFGHQLATRGVIWDVHFGDNNGYLSNDVVFTS